MIDLEKLKKEKLQEISIKKIQTVSKKLDTPQLIKKLKRSAEKIKNRLSQEVYDKIDKLNKANRPKIIAAYKEGKETGNLNKYYQLDSDHRLQCDNVYKVWGEKVKKVEKKLKEAIKKISG
jgi:uncharacterized protein (UPF0248 family)